MKDNKKINESKARFRVGVDVGGTFTDVVASVDGRLAQVTKVPSTPGHLVKGVLNGVESILARMDGSGSQVQRFVHGTTIGTNAVLERKGARIAVLTTAGFEDVLELGRLRRSALYDLFFDAETPVFLAPRRRRYGVPERIDAQGRVVRDLDEAALRDIVADAIAVEKAEAFAVCYLFSYLNDRHEQRTREIIREIAPEASVSLSSDVNPLFREYERTVVTAFDAYVKPVLNAYLSILGRELREAGIHTRLQVMQSRGGIASAENALARPVQLLLSGPAAGVIGGQFEGARGGCRDVITFDMGGTSSDVALVRDGRPLTTTEAKMKTWPLRVPMIDVSTIGAGGGSIAWIDPGGGLRVGPRSAGSDPGPACYPGGGPDPTVTDASVVLGYLNPRNFAGGQLTLDVDAAHRAVGGLAERLGMSVREASLGIHRVVNANMADQIRLASVKRGHDPRKFALVAFGGAGPVHGGPLAADIGIPTMIVPQSPGVLSALGLLVAPVEHEHLRTFVARTPDIDVRELRNILAMLDAQGLAAMETEGVARDRISTRYAADMRYVGQSYELEVDVPDTTDRSTPDELARRFHDAHERVYAHAQRDNAVETVNLRVVHSFLPSPPSPAAGRAGRADSSEPRESRRAVFAEYPGGGDAAVFDRLDLAPDTVIDGPAIVEQSDTTTVVYPGHRCTVGDDGLLFVTFADRRADRRERHELGERIQ